MEDDRKRHHIDLALEAKTTKQTLDTRFEYDPIHAIHPISNSEQALEFGAYILKFPIWISSMTGGTELAKDINTNLAKACGEFGLGMGLGSCRKLIENPALISEYDVKQYMEHQPLFANMGIAQLEQYIQEKKLVLLSELLKRLRADGMIIHVNPLQEWMQKEGDRFQQRPIDTIKKTMDQLSCHIIVKEVGQGMGMNSLKALFQLPLLAIEFGAYGGTNFSKLETMRYSDQYTLDQLALNHVGHDAQEMLEYCNEIFSSQKVDRKFRLIISGGIQTVLDGFYLISKSKIPAVYGQASAFLKYARISYESLQQYLIAHTQTFMAAKQFLRIK